MKSGKAIVVLLGVTVALVVSFQNCSKQSVDFGIADSTKPGPNDCEFGTSFVRNGQSVTSYLVSSVNPGQTCLSEQRYCDKGRLTGSFGYNTCSVGVPSACLLGNITVNHGSSVNAYSSNQVSAGSSCESVKMIRTCNDGVLSGLGNFTFASCSVAEVVLPKNCSLSNVNIVHGQSAPFYSTSTAPIGQLCQSQQRTCTDGVLSGSNTYSYSKCENTKEDQFSVKIGTATSMPVDIILVLDNSGSMKNSTAQVQNNIPKLISAIKDRTNIRLGIISSKLYKFIGLGLDIKEMDGYSQMNGRIEQAVQNVESFDALDCVLKLTGGRRILDSISSNSPIFGNSPDIYACNSAREPITYFSSGFLRQTSHKIIIAVTDDESSFKYFRDLSTLVFGYQEFLTLLNPNYFVTPPKSNPNTTFFGFIGLGAASPCQASRGTYYEKLAQETGGQVFNICDTDWTNNFNKITGEALLINSSSLMLSYTGTSIMEVKINNTLISSDKYKLSGKYIYIDFASLNLTAGSTYSISVKYKYLAQ